MNVIRRLELARKMLAGIRALDEAVIHQVGHMVSRRMAAHVTAHAPVIDHVIYILNCPFRFRAATLVADPQVVRKRHVFALAEAAEPLRSDAGTNNAMLKSDVVRFAQSDTIPAAPLNRNMVENHASSLT